MSTLEAWRSRAVHRVRHVAVAPPPPPERTEVVTRRCLTDREVEVVTHIRDAYRKIGTTRRSQVVVWGLSNGL